MVIVTIVPVSGFPEVLPLKVEGTPVGEGTEWYEVGDRELCVVVVAFHA